MNLRALIIILGIVVSSGAKAIELVGQPTTERSRKIIQHLPQDTITSILSFVDYPTLGKFRRVCKTWYTLITEKLPIQQRYTLKLIQQFSKGFKTFEKMFLTSLTRASLGKTVLDDIIEELQEDSIVTKEQAYQALVDTKLMQSCPDMQMNIYVDERPTPEQKEIVFPYISPNLLNQILKEPNHQKIRITIKRTDTDIIQLFGLKNLSIDFQNKVTELDLSDLKLRSIPRQIQRLSDVYWLSLSDNQLGSVPSEIGQLTRLQRLFLYNNRLDSVPSEIGQLTNLWDLYLSNNQLSTIPSEIGQLTNLQTLYLHYNQLNSVPSEIGQLTNLRYLYLSSNKLNSLSAQIGRLTNLQQLYLHNNQLSSVPREIENLTNLRHLYLQNNQLNGVPSEIKKALPNCEIIY